MKQRLIILYFGFCIHGLVYTIGDEQPFENVESGYRSAPTLQNEQKSQQLEQQSQNSRPENQGKTEAWKSEMGTPQSPSSRSVDMNDSVHDQNRADIEVNLDFFKGLDDIARASLVTLKRARSSQDQAGIMSAKSLQEQLKNDLKKIASFVDAIKDLNNKDTAEYLELITALVNKQDAYCQLLVGQSYKFQFEAVQIQNTLNLLQDKLQQHAKELQQKYSFNAQELAYLKQQNSLNIDDLLQQESGFGMNWWPWK